MANLINMTYFTIYYNNKKDKVYGYEVVCEDKDIKQLIKENLDIKGYVLGLGIGVGGNLLNRYNYIFAVIYFI